MSTPEQRFEVPPEYAEVYERAYRRAYDEGREALEPGSVTGSPPRSDTESAGRPPAPDRSPVTAGRPPAGARPRGRRVAVPAQRDARHRSEVPATGGSTGAAHRAPGRTAAVPSVGVIGLAVLLVLVSFLLGRCTAPDRPDPPDRPATTGRSGEAVNPTDATTYPGATRVIAVRSAASSCAALTGRGGEGPPSLADDVLDDDPATAWRCGGLATGERLRFVLPRGSRVVQVGILPGFARSDPSTGTDDYATSNRITRVRWDLGDGVSVTQELSADPQDRSLRTLAVPATTSSAVVLVIEQVQRGQQDQTAISTVRLWAAR